MSMHASKQPDALLQGAVDEGYFKQQPWKGAGQARAEVNLHAMTAGVAMLSLYCWLVGLKQQVDQFGSTTLPTTLAIVTDKVWPSLSCDGLLLLSVCLFCCLWLMGLEQKVAQFGSSLVSCQPAAPWQQGYCLLHLHCIPLPPHPPRTTSFCFTCLACLLQIMLTQNSDALNTTRA